MSRRFLRGMSIRYLDAMSTPTSRPKRSSRKKSEAPDEELIAEISSWARSNGSSDDAVIKMLLQDLSEMNGLDAWSTLPTMELLPAVDTKEADLKIKIANRIAIIRNLLVFAPVALTWYAVNKAVTAFGEYTRANQGSVVNFLEFWENGYGVLDDKWTIDHVAFFDFALITLVIALSLVVSYFEIQHKKILSTSIARRENDRLALGIKIHRYLTEKRQTTPEVVNANVTNSIRNLLLTSKELSKASKALAKDLKNVNR